MLGSQINWVENFFKSRTRWWKTMWCGCWCKFFISSAFCFLILQFFQFMLIFEISSLAAKNVTGGFSGAELVAICREAALFAIEEDEETTQTGKPIICMRHMMKSINGMKRQITPEIIDLYAKFRNGTLWRKHLGIKRTTLKHLKIRVMFNNEFWIVSFKKVIFRFDVKVTSAWIA